MLQPALCGGVGRVGAVTAARVGDALYVADTFNHTVRRVSLSDFSVTTVAGSAGVAGEVDGAGTAARSDARQGLTVARGALYAAGFS